MKYESLGKYFLHELETEVASTGKCLERIPESLFTWKPHERSMPLGYLALLVAEIPKWITDTIESSEIDFATYKHIQPKTTAELVNHYDENIKGAKRALQKVSDKELEELFYLKNKGVTLLSMPKDDSVGQSLNHWVHHRGQLSVYMRLNDIPVPSIYGPSADDSSF